MNILITGAGNGIGYYTAAKLSQQKGNKIIALSRNAASLGKLAAEAEHGNIIPLALDLTTAGMANQVYKFCLSHFTQLDILINNAGALVSKPFHKLTESDFELTLQVNYVAPALLIQNLLPLMGQSQLPTHIVNIGTMGAVQGSAKFAGLAAYSSSKGALATLTECLAEELKEDNIAVNYLALGAVQTAMLEAAFPGFRAPVSPQQMADYIAWFATNAHAHTNGKITSVSQSTP